MNREKSFKRNSLVIETDDESKSIRKLNKSAAAKGRNRADFCKVTTNVNELLTRSQKNNSYLANEKLNNGIDIDDIVSKLKRLSEKNYKKIKVVDLVEEEPQNSDSEPKNKSGIEFNSRDFETEEENCSTSEAFFQGTIDIEKFLHKSDNKTLIHKAQLVKSIPDLEPDCICWLISKFLPSLIDIKEEKVVKAYILF